jgi:hypothetical protein
MSTTPQSGRAAILHGEDHGNESIVLELEKMTLATVNGAFDQCETDQL